MPLHSTTSLERPRHCQPTTIPETPPQHCILWLRRAIRTKHCDLQLGVIPSTKPTQTHTHTH